MNLNNNDMFSQMYTSVESYSAAYFGDMSSICFSGHFTPYNPIAIKKIIKCEYCGSSNCFEYKEFNCVKCGAPLKIAKPF